MWIGNVYRRLCWLIFGTSNGYPIFSMAFATISAGVFFFFQCNSWWPSCEFVDYFIISTNVLGSWIGILFVNVWISNLDCWMFAYIRIFSILDTRNILWFIFRTHKLLNECDYANLSRNSLLSDQVVHDSKIFVYLFHFLFSHLWTVGGFFKVLACSLYWQP